MAKGMRAQPQGVQPARSDAFTKELLVDRQSQLGEEQRRRRRCTLVDRRQHQRRVGAVREANDDRLVKVA
eukprot:16442053-Heterocapsa_arctica.AAC.1